ncbi:FecR family protein [Echinicola marina]|uniref:FecR family protein n=1 Tax=Echinicola marina TaxID=2859768 RepID=UPI001CF64797|nr:FecR family protein [Echinicola marina]UCS95289.1 FecR family protein [Echinicola marina]
MKREEFLKLAEKHRQGTASKSENKLVEKFYDNMQHHSTSEDIESILSNEKGQALFLSILGTLYDEKKTNSRAIWPILKVAVALTLILVMGITFKHIADHRKITLATGMGEQKEILLKDGSTVTLAENSSLTYPNSFGNKREVILKGRAFFDIYRDTTSPFLVHTKNTEIKVLGTSFDVNSPKNESTTVSVISGQVQVSPHMHPEKAVVISRNQQLTCLHSQISAITSFSHQEPIAWTKLIVLKNTSLGEAAKILEDRFGLEIKFESNELKKQQISGKFKNETAENILKSIALLKQCSYEYLQPNIIYIKEKQIDTP